MGTLQSWVVSTATAPIQPTADQIDQVALAVRDLGSVVVIGTTSDTTARVTRYVDAVGGGGNAVLIGTSRTTDPVSAALLNGTAAQAFDFDDIAPSCVSHVSAIVVPAVLALLDRVDPERALIGIVKGLTVIDRLAEAFTHEVYDRGIQPTHTMGPIGALTALLHAFDADEATADAAFGLLATQMIGLRSHTGTTYKPAQAGIVSAAAVRSMLLAQEGVDAGHDAIDVVMRLLGITDRQLEELQRPGDLQPVALAPKWYPTCGAAHTAIEATLDLRRQVGDRADAGDARITVTSPPRVMNALAFARPGNPDEARFSMEYCVGSAWRNGSLGPADFSPEALANQIDVVDLVDVVIDDALSPPPTWSGFPAVVSVTWPSDGKTESTRVERPLGYPERPLTHEQRRDKFVACVEPVLGRDTAESAFQAIVGPAALARLVEQLTV